MCYNYNLNFINGWVMRHREFKEVDLRFSACYQKCMFEHCHCGLSLHSSFLFYDALG